MVDELDPVEPKHPSESKTYTMDWSGGLNSGATISTTAWAIAPSGLTNAADSIVTGSLKTSIRVSAGNDATDYECKNTITTSDSETLVKIGIIKVRS